MDRVVSVARSASDIRADRVMALFSLPPRLARTAVDLTGQYRVCSKRTPVGTEPQPVAVPECAPQGVRPVRGAARPGCADASFSFSLGLLSAGLF